MFGYVYITTNHVNGKIYIGQKASSEFLGNKYLGSGSLLFRAIKKYGHNNFSVKLLECCESKNDLDEREKFYIDKFNSTDKCIGYNISCGGQGGNLGDEVNKRISKSLTGHPCSESTKNKLRIANTGKTLSQEARNKISLKNLGKVISDETKQKMSKSAKLIDRSNRVCGNKGKMAITNGIDVKYVSQNEAIPEGWYAGNCHTSGKHDMSNYTDEMRAHRREISKGENNNMFGQGHKIAGGKNGKATHIYIYKNTMYECRKYLHEALQLEGYTFSINTLRAMLLNPNSTRLRKRYGNLIDLIETRHK